MNEPLSPSAQVVLDACFYQDHPSARHILAAALEAVADQVVYFPGRYPLNEYMEGMREAKREVREKLLAIAAELKQ
jgi:hypothetical protein